MADAKSRDDKRFPDKKPAKGRGPETRAAMRDRHGREVADAHARQQSEMADMHKRHQTEHKQIADRQMQEMMAGATPPEGMLPPQGGMAESPVGAPPPAAPPNAKVSGA